MSQSPGRSKLSEKGLLTPDNCVVAYKRGRKPDVSKKIATASAGLMCSAHGRQQQLAWFANT